VHTQGRFTNRLCRLKPRASKISITVVRIESITVTVYDKFDKYAFVNNFCFSFFTFDQILCR